MWKRFSIIFTFLLIFQTITPGLVVPLETKAEGNGSISDGEIESEDAAETKMIFKWSAAGKDLKAGDIAEKSLPDGYEVQGSGELFDDAKVASLGTTNDTVTLTFNEGIEDNPQASGKIVVDVVNTAVAEQIADDEESAEAEDTTSDDEEKFEGKEENEEANPDADESKKDKLTSSEENEETGEEATEENEKKPGKAGYNDDKNSNKVTLADNEKHGFTLKLSNATDMDGNPFDDDHQLGLGEEFYLDLEWDLEDGHNHVEGDVQTFELPHGIKIQEEFEIELKSDGLHVAHAVVKTDGTIELTFTDFVETHSEVKGHMQIVSMIDEDNVEVEDGEIVLKPIGDEGEIRIPIDLGDREKTIEKEGAPNKGYNADEINWEVTINKMKNNLINATVTDVLPEGTEFKEGILKVTKLDVDLNGNIRGDLEEIEITGDSVEDGTLNIPMGDIKDAYKIEYVTNVTDDVQKTFKNDATLSDDDLDDVSADATATINRGDPIKKSAANSYNPKTGIIEWEMKFNFNQKDLEDITLKDAWTPKGKMHLVEESLKFQEVSIDENGNAQNEGEAINLPEGAELVNGEDQFEVTRITTDKAYKVTYQTKVNDRVLDGFDVSNTAGFGNESDGSGTGIGTYYGSKSAGNVDYKDKTIDWTIELNHDEYPMEKISILDTLGDGLTLDNDSIEITVDGNEYTGDYTVSDDNPFELKFPEEFTTDKKIVITYKTDFVADEVTDSLATNKADITWKPERDSDSITKEVKANKKLNKKTKDNSWKNGSYNPDTKEITWTIYTNYRENSLDNLIVKDEPQGNQKIVKDSAVVTELEIDENGDITEGDPQDGVSTIDVDNNTLDVNIGETNKAYKIEYKTSLAGLSDIQKEYVNKAEVFDGGTSLSEIDAKVGIAKAHTYAAKSGEQEGKQVHWAVTVNPGQQKVTNLKLEDTVSDNQDILNDTFTVYEADVDGDGNATKKGEPISSDRYELTHEEGEPTFTIEWNDTVERAFIVEYSTLFFAGHNEDVTNSYDITGDNIVEGGKTDGSGSVKIKQFGSGGGVGTAGYLVIDKVDTTFGQEEAKLKGAAFDLIDADTGKILKSGITDKNGQIDFGRLLFGDYQLKETTVPEGYVTPEETETITIDKKYDSTADKTEYAYQVENYVPVFAIDLIKEDKEGNPLLGAEFALFDLDNEVAEALQTETTNEEGKILFEDLEKAGTYYVQEIKAPEGYALDRTKHKVEVGAKESEAVEITIDNSPRGTVQLKKVDNNDKTLEGAEFDLQKEIEQGEFETIDSFTTNETGIIETSNTLEPGNYQFVETKAPQFYEKVDTRIEFTIDGTETEAIELTVKNTLKQGSVELTKIDEFTEKVLADAVFELRDSEGNVVEGYDNLTTDENGKIGVTGLDIGEYRFVETKAPIGYELDQDPIKFEMENEQTKLVTVTAENKVKPGTVELIKTETDFAGILIEGAEFELQDSEGNKVEEDSNGDTLTNPFTTDKNGRIVVEDLRPGDYQFVETSAPDGFKLDDTPINFTIDKEQSKILTVEAKNELESDSVVLKKVDSRNNEKTLEGAEFKLEKKNDDEIQVVEENLTTDENGLIVVKDLPDGEYQFIETKAPPGYRLNSDPQEFTIGGEQTEPKKVTITVENTKRPTGGGGTPPPTDPEDPTDPEEPGEEDPEDPTDPEDPGEEDPEDPEDPTDPEDPQDPEEPGEEDPDKPGTEDPNQPDPEQPNEEDPEDPNGDVQGDGDEDNDNDNSSNPSIKSDNDKGNGINNGTNNGVNKVDANESEHDGNMLPQTGEDKFLMMFVLGTLFVIAGGTLLFRRVRKEN